MLTSVPVEWMSVISTVTITLAPTHAPAMTHTLLIQADSSVMVLLHFLTVCKLNLVCSCIDINECAEGAVGSEICLGLCMNDPGSFYCDCYPGYTLNHDMVSCSGRSIKKLMTFNLSINWFWYCRSWWVCYRSCPVWSDLCQHDRLTHLPLQAGICTEYWRLPLWW